MPTGKSKPMTTKDFIEFYEAGRRKQDLVFRSPCITIHDVEVMILGIDNVLNVRCSKSDTRFCIFITAMATHSHTVYEAAHALCSEHMPVGVCPVISVTSAHQTTADQIEAQKQQEKADKPWFSQRLEHPKPGDWMLLTQDPDRLCQPAGNDPDEVPAKVLGVGFNKGVMQYDVYNISSCAIENWVPESRLRLLRYQPGDIVESHPGTKFSVRYMVLSYTANMDMHIVAVSRNHVETEAHAISANVWKDPELLDHCNRYKTPSCEPHRGITFAECIRRYGPPRNTYAAGSVMGPGAVVYNVISAIFAFEREERHCVLALARPGSAVGQTTLHISDAKPAVDWLFYPGNTTANPKVPPPPPPPTPPKPRLDTGRLSHSEPAWRHIPVKLGPGFPAQPGPLPAFLTKHLTGSRYRADRPNIANGPRHAPPAAPQCPRCANGEAIKWPDKKVCFACGYPGLKPLLTDKDAESICAPMTRGDSDGLDAARSHSNDTDHHEQDFQRRYQESIYVGFGNGETLKERRQRAPYRDPLYNPRFCWKCGHAKGCAHQRPKRSKA